MSLLDDGANGGGQGSGGGTPPAGGDGGGGAGTPGGANPPASGAPGGAQATWRDSLPDDIKADPSLQAFTDVAGLAKSYLHTKAHVGKKGVIVPTDKSSDEEWAQFYDQIGRPAEDKYAVTPPKDVPVNDELVKKFQKTARDAGLLPKQAQKLLEWFAGEEQGMAASKTLASQAKSKEQIEALKKEWGDAFDQEKGRANAILNEVGGDELKAFVKENGLQGSVPLVKFLNKVAKMLPAEHQLRGDGGGGQKQTPAEIQAEIDKVMGNTSHPYFNRNHAEHKGAVTMVEGLYKKLHGNS
jgi:hypothetical protein